MNQCVKVNQKLSELPPPPRLRSTITYFEVEDIVKANISLFNINFQILKNIYIYIYICCKSNHGFPYDKYIFICIHTLLVLETIIHI